MNDSMKIRFRFHLILNLDGEEKTYTFETELENLREVDSLTKTLLTDKRCKYMDVVRLD